MWAEGLTIDYSFNKDKWPYLMQDFKMPTSWHVLYKIPLWQLILFVTVSIRFHPCSSQYITDKPTVYSNVTSHSLPNTCSECCGTASVGTCPECCISALIGTWFEHCVCALVGTYCMGIGWHIHWCCVWASVCICSEF